MEERERCYSFILSRTPHETYIIYSLFFLTNEYRKFYSVAIGPRKQHKVRSTQTLKLLSLQGVVKVDRQKWSSCVNHVIEIKIYEVNNHVENTLEFIINVSAENSSKESVDHILVKLCSSA
jgi:hypothetical protein